MVLIPKISTIKSQLEEIQTVTGTQGSWSEITSKTRTSLAVEQGLQAKQPSSCQTHVQQCTKQMSWHHCQQPDQQLSRPQVKESSSTQQQCDEYNVVC